MTGVRSPNITSRPPISDSIVVNRNGSTGLQSTEDLARQLAGTAPIRYLAGNFPMFDTVDDLEEAVLVSKVSAWVVADPDADLNGVYGWTGSAWVWVLPLPYSFVVGQDTGAGSPNAIQISTRVPVSQEMVITVSIFEDTTGSPVTVSINGGAPLTVKTNRGSNASALTAGMDIWFRIRGTDARLLNDQNVSALVAQAESFRDQAQAFAAIIDPSTYYTKTAADARYAPTVHSHLAANITDFATSVDARIAALSPVAPSLITGGEIDRVNANALQVHPCQMANGGGNPTEVLRTTANKTLNPTIVGVGGMDIGPAPAVDTMLYVYMIKHLTTGQTEFILSREVSFSNITYPSGYGAAKVAKHPLAFPYKSIGFPPFYHTRNFSALYFTDSDDAGYYDLVANTNTAGAWATVSAAAWMPDSARACIFMSRTDYNSGSGEARVRPGSGTAAAGFVVGKINASGQSDWTGQHCIRTNSTRELARNVGAAVRNWIQIVGYCPLEI